MKYEDAHLSDEEMLMQADGELPLGAPSASTSSSHCWACRARMPAWNNIAIWSICIGDFDRPVRRQLFPRCSRRLAAAPRSTGRVGSATLVMCCDRRNRFGGRALVLLVSYPECFEIRAPFPQFT